MRVDGQPFAPRPDRSPDSLDDILMIHNVVSHDSRRVKLPWAELRWQESNPCLNVFEDFTASSLAPSAANGQGCQWNCSKSLSKTALCSALS
ncbi:hypothetical protein PoB_006244500 [Plakobranchus ocellatus]|uniref:Uncharacterized protein n=1 Tax=Plakobranchus ocellatus TaxID=259542 RepID=A0AAV4CVP5_9GAST|nr:hypothetical protein PoB_006244500 [Plakobranchus ocellatus]